MWSRHPQHCEIVELKFNQLMGKLGHVHSAVVCICL